MKFHSYLKKKKKVIFTWHETILSTALMSRTEQSMFYFLNQIHLNIGNVPET